MSGKYGEMLSGFPEAFVSVLYFNMQPIMNAGYGERDSIRTIRVSFQDDIGSETKKNEFNLVDTDNKTLWVRERLNKGWFLEIESDVYRIVRANKYKSQAGFFIHEIERLVGDNGNNTANAPNNFGNRLFA